MSPNNTICTVELACLLPFPPLTYHSPHFVGDHAQLPCVFKHKEHTSLPLSDGPASRWLGEDFSPYSRAFLSPYSLCPLVYICACCKCSFLEFFFRLVYAGRR